MLGKQGATEGHIGEGSGSDCSVRPRRVLFDPLVSLIDGTPQ